MISIDTVISGQSLSKMPLHRVEGENVIAIPAHEGWNTWNFPYNVFSRHVLAVGGIGCGKTTLIFHLTDAVIRQMKEDDVVVVFDPKQDYLKKFYRYGDIVVGNPERLQGYPVSFWNIFCEVENCEGSRIDLLRELAASLFAQKIASAKDPTFATGASDLFAGLMEALLRRGESDLNNASLRERLCSMSIDEIKEIFDAHGDLRWLTIYLHAKGSATTQSYLSPLYAVINEVFSGCFGRKGDFGMRRTIQKKGGKIVFLEYDFEHAHLFASVFTLLLDLAAKEALTNTVPERHATFLLDELPVIPRLNYMDALVNFGRTRGVQVIGAIQNVSQMRSTYGEADANSILSGFSTWVAFHMNDSESRKIFTERHGSNQKLLRLAYADARQNGSQMYERGSVIEDWEIVELCRGRCIVSMPDHPPYLFYPDEYRSSPSTSRGVNVRPVTVRRIQIH